MVPSDDDVRAVCLGPDGLLAALRPEAVVMVCSSVHPDTVREIAAVAGAGRAPAILDAALTGGVRAAEQGSVNLLVGGDGDALDRTRRFLEPWCASVHHLGPLGAGQVAKSANNLVHWAQICAIEEALDLARRHGLSVPAVRAALMAGPTDSRTLRELERMRLTWWAKDLESIERLGADVGRDLPVAAMCAGRMPGITVEALHELLDSEA
jgi:3-hydroxyisobutyrate dehydrogenase-like beta-hydroxyacid dehydrogenase